ncbi:MAG: ABC transporter permease [Planctomycetota bacterium]|nr:MAG: ABC transporter permease [Planctomycetota bacterium]
MHSIWAVAKNTIKQAVRMKIAAVFIILLLILLPLMAVSMTGDGTLKGRLQTFISYGLSLTTFLLCFLTIIISIYSLTSDIDQRQIYTVITKPIRRYQLLLGKLLGVILLDVGLLALFSAIIYATAIYIPKFSEASDTELTKLNNEFFTARASIIPPKTDVSQEVDDTYKKLEDSGQLPPDVLDSKLARDSYKKGLAKRIELSKRAASVGHELVWEFKNVKPLDPNQSLFVRFKYDVSLNPPDSQVYSRWVVGDIRQMPFEIYTFDRKDFIRTFYEIEVPADAVADDGYLAVAFLNVPLNNTVVIFPPEDGLEVLYKADTFTANFIRAVLLIFLRLIFLACLGTLAASFLSFPAALLFCLVVFLTGTISGFCLESFDLMGENLSRFYSYTVRPIVQLLPQFDKFSPTKFLVPARLLNWSLLAKVAVSLICIKAILVGLLAFLIFNFREIAKVVI